MPKSKRQILKNIADKKFNPQNHPRYPKGHPRGGKFMNKGASGVKQPDAFPAHEIEIFNDGTVFDSGSGEVVTLSKASSKKWGEHLGADLAGGLSTKVKVSDSDYALIMKKKTPPAASSSTPKTPKSTTKPPATTAKASPKSETKSKKAATAPAKSKQEIEAAKKQADEAAIKLKQAEDFEKAKQAEKIKQAQKLKQASDRLKEAQAAKKVAEANSQQAESILLFPGSKPDNPIPPPRKPPKPNTGSHEDIMPYSSREDKYQAIAKLTNLSLEEAESAAWGTYAFTGDHYTDMRKHDRGQSIPEQHPLIGDWTESANKFLDNMPTYKGSAYRGVNFPVEVYDEFLSKAVPGAKMRIDAMSSFSSNVDTAKGYSSGKQGNRIIMSVAANKSGVSVKGVSKYPREDEVLVPRGSTYRVIGVRVEDAGDGLPDQPKITYIDLEDISYEY